MHKFLSGPRALSEDAQHRAGGGGRGGLLDAAHDHTQMGALHDDRDTLRLEDLRDGHGDLLRETFLQLQTTRKHLGDTCKLRQSQDLPVGNVADVHFACEWYEVVLTHGEDLDVFDNNCFAPAR